MSIDFIDRDYLQKLRNLAKKRGVELVLEEGRLTDERYIRALQRKYPLTTTEAQWSLAKDISRVVSKPLTIAEAANDFHVRRFIDENLPAFEQVAPTQEMRTFVRRIAAQYHVGVPENIFLNRAICEEWIENFRSPAVTEVVELMNELSFTHSSFIRIATRAGITLKDGDWTQTPAFLNFVLDKYGAALSDSASNRKLKHDRARSMLAQGIDAFSVATALQLPDSEVAAIEQTIEGYDEEEISRRKRA